MKGYVFDFLSPQVKTYLLSYKNLKINFFCISLSGCVIVIKYETSKSIIFYVLPLLKKVIEVFLISNC